MNCAGTPLVGYAHTAIASTPVAVVVAESLALLADALPSPGDRGLAVAMGLERLVHVPDHSGPAQLADPVHAFGGPGTVECKVAAVDDQLRLLPLQVGEHGFERDQVAMDVRDDRYSHGLKG